MLLTGKSYTSMEMIPLNYKFPTFGIILLTLLLSCSEGENKTQTKAGDVEITWYRNPFIYNVDVDAFKDSDGDGVGDFKGLTWQLDYLKDLGVDVLWLSPFQPTPDNDDGYDITDYYGIDSRLGREKDFSKFMQEAKKRHMKVIMDIVLNHTSIEHPWYQKARADTNSKINSWYVWSKSKPKDFNKGMVFPGTQTETWTWDDVAKHYYFHRFYDFQPDLNYTNKDVQREAAKILKFWLSKGVDGFRLDAVPFIIDIPETGSAAPEHMFDILTMLRDTVKADNPDAVLLGEANVTAEENKDFFGDKGERLQMMFNFYANQYLFYSLASQDPIPFSKALKAFRVKPGSSQWAFFLRNHDEVDLARLSKSERKMVYDKFGPEANMQLYDRGIRRRLAPMLSNPASLKMAYHLLFSLPGAPVIRYGEELGMGDDLTLKERLSVRTPMQWDSSRNAGFSTSVKTFRPIIMSGEYAYPKVNVAKEERDPSSILVFIKQMVKLRKEHPEVGLGDWQIVKSTDGVFIIKYNYGDKTLVSVSNFTSENKQLDIKHISGNKKQITPLISAKTQKTSSNTIVLPGYGFQWFELK
jgi:maltose alpha-D-glucosyltransferase/alpha-amylase